MKKIPKALLLSLCIAGVFIISCRKFSPNPTWDTNILAPLVSTTLSINNLVTDSLVHQNADSSITLVYNGSLYNLNPDSLAKIPDTTLSYPYPFFSNQTFHPGDSLPFPGGSYTNYGVSSVQLTKATIQSGYLVYEISSPVDGITDLTYSIPSATIGAAPFKITIKVPARVGTTPGYIKDSASLAGYNIDLTGKTHNGYNTIYTIAKAILDYGDSSATVKIGDIISVKASFDNMIPYYAQGYFGTSTKTYTQTTPFNIFKKITSGTLNLQSLNVTLTLQNNIGVDAQVKITNLTSINSRTGKDTNLVDAALIGNTININRATQTYNPSSPVTPSIQTFNITPSNSNILAWIDNLPSSVAYSVQVTTDPLGNVSGSNDFAFYGYGIQSNLNISMPLSLIASNLTLADTLPVSFGGSNQAKNVKSGTFTLYANNGFPFSAGLQIYVLDKNMKVTDSLMTTPQTIPAGIMNGSGIVISPSVSNIVMVLNETRAADLINAQHIIIMSRFNMGSLPSTYRKIYSYNSLSVKLVGNFDYLIKG